LRRFDHGSEVEGLGALGGLVIVRPGLRQALAILRGALVRTSFLIDVPWVRSAEAREDTHREFVKIGTLNTPAGKI